MGMYKYFNVFCVNYSAYNRTFFYLTTKLCAFIHRIEHHLNQNNGIINVDVVLPVNTNQNPSEYALLLD